MARAIERLSAVAIGKFANRTGVFCDGGGLYLHSILRRLNVHGSFATGLAARPTGWGSGPYPAISLAKARELASNARTQKTLGTDPIERRDTDRSAALLAVIKAVTFRECAEN